MIEQFDPNHENCGTTECCMQCNTAYLGKDWFLVAINPWFRIHVNPISNEVKKISFKPNNVKSK